MFTHAFFSLFFCEGFLVCDFFGDEDDFFVFDVEEEVDFFFCFVCGFGLFSVVFFSGGFLVFSSLAFLDASSGFVFFFGFVSGDGFFAGVFFSGGSFIFSSLLSSSGSSDFSFANSSVRFVSSSSSFSCVSASFSISFFVVSERPRSSFLRLHLSV
jgi:hypothetical protein